jgi:hypothetical protein
MNLLCPNCQKPLTVPDQYAGQPMRCPLCQGTFTVPGLPPMPGAVPATPAAAMPGAAPPLPPEPALASAPPPPGDVYGLKPEPPPGAAAPGGPPPLAPPPPGVDDAVLEELPPAAPPRGPGLPSYAPPAPQGAAPTPYVEGEPTYPATPTPEGYQHKFVIWFSPRILQFVAPVAVLMIFVLQFFAWVGVYPGGVAAAWQNPWQAAFGFRPEEPDLKRIFAFTTDEELKDNKDISDPKDQVKDNRPGVSVLTIFYLLLFIPTLLVTLACGALVFIPPSQVPPALHQILPWRWGIVAALNLIVFLFLALQLVLGFSLEWSVAQWGDAKVEKEVRDQEKKEEKKDKSTVPQKEVDAKRGEKRAWITRTVWLNLAVFFHVLAILGAAVMFWLNRRGARPAPQINMLW